jgi:hypothetical protein
MKESGMGGTCSINGEQEKCIEVSVGKPNVTRPLRIPRNKWMIILKLVLKIRLEGREVD